jgi:hypothetical protein
MPTATLAQQRAFFETYGFLKLPGLLKNGIAGIIAEFEAVFPQVGPNPDGSKRRNFVPFIDQRPALCALLDHPGILEAVGNLIGPDFNYVGSDGNYYTGDTGWHRDSLYQSSSYLKVAFYLDRVTKDTGCLRVIPGSHHDAAIRIFDGTITAESEANFGVHGRDLPHFPLENEPGDVLLFNHRVLHASFGGSTSRRMFTMNLGRRAKDPKEVDDLISYLSYHLRPHGNTPYGPAMLETADSARQVHLSQVPQFWAAGGEHYKLRTAKPGVA